jgi:signal transduction histidine kinase
VASGNYGYRLVVHRRDELGALAAAFNKMAAQLEETERNRQEFLASISHELRTPLTSIRGFVQGILDGTIPQDRQQAYLSRVYSEAQRLAEIVNDLLDLARLRSGQMRLEPKPVDLWALCGEVAECLLPAAREKEVEIVLNLPAAAAVVEADAKRLVQALLNIGDNAVKFTRQGGTVEIVGRIQGGRAEIAVRDQGPGIDLELAPRIFEKFFTGGPGGGTGLGLAITKALVEAHAGEIELESQPGQGSIFRIFLPLSQQGSGGCG